MPEAYRLNDYVLNGKGDPAKLIGGMYFWTWNTEEVLDMVQWMRQFNASGKGHVEFTGFDMQTPNVALEIVRDFSAKADPEYAATIKHASELALAPVLTQQPNFGTASGIFPLEAARGKTIRFSGWIKTQDVSQYAGFWWRSDAGQKPLTFANLGDAAPKGTTDWKQYQLELEVPADATVVYWGPLLAGSGTAWFDDLKIEIDGKPYTGEAYDLGFEGPALKGLFPTMPLIYPSKLDTEIVHSGYQSLRISHTQIPPDPRAIDPKTGSAEWAKIVQHMESSRGLYAKQQLSAREVEWAIQNARVVLQCMQMKANQVSRDASMAANVKWILDQNPNAKIVLWAHNGHVSTLPASMGTELRKIYGSQMATFAFSFSEGGFQAVAPGKGLKNFTVPPAPADSLDAGLASAGIPLFALDLRAAPKNGAVSGWLAAPHQTRSIGSMYPEDSPFAMLTPQTPREVCDVILFVRQVTAAHPLISAPARLQQLP
jgi:erythromycin esterase-like protein